MTYLEKNQDRLVERFCSLLQSLWIFYWTFDISMMSCYLGAGYYRGNFKTVSKRKSAMQEWHRACLYTMRACCSVFPFIGFNVEIVNEALTNIIKEITTHLYFWATCSSCFYIPINIKYAYYEIKKFRLRNSKLMKYLQQYIFMLF